MATKKSTKAKTPKAAPRKPASKKASPKKAQTMAPAGRKIRPGFISHTELASRDPAATKQWCTQVLGWKFMPSMPTPAGPYHMWSFGDDTGGGIRANSPQETPGSIPYVEVPDIKAAYSKAIAAGATGMLPPDKIPGTTDWLAIVSAPGGVAIGFWAPK